MKKYVTSIFRAQRLSGMTTQALARYYGVGDPVVRLWLNKERLPLNLNARADPAPKTTVFEQASEIYSQKWLQVQLVLRPSQAA